MPGDAAPRSDLIRLDDNSIIYDVSSPCILEAAAGSGKTTVLVERYLASFLYSFWTTSSAVRDIMEGIVAITFTRKAALEMKNRIRGKIAHSLDHEYLAYMLQQLREHSGLKLREPEDVLIRRALDIRPEILQALPAARISTIHSFALGLLRAWPVESGVDPALRPQEEDSHDSESLTVHSALLRSIQMGLEQSQTCFRILIASLGYQDFLNKLEDLFRLLREKGWDNLKVNFLKQGAQPYNSWEDFQDRLLQAVVGKAARLRELAQSHLELNVIKDLVKLISDLDVILSGDVLHIFHCSLTLKLNTELKNKPEISDLRAHILAGLEQLNDTLTDLFRPAWAEVLETLWQVYTQAKIQKQEITFQDIEEKILLALEKRPDFSGQVLKHLQFLLLDEYQDTSPLQHRLFLSLLDQARGSRVVPFIVGDPKQSIYGFRGSDITVFFQTRDMFRLRYGEKSIRYLNNNYRSLPELVQGFNTVFSTLFREGSIDYHPQDSPREAESTLVPLWYLPARYDNVEECFTDSCQQAARLIRRLMQEEGYRAGDFLLLLRKKSRSSYLTQALRQELPGVNLVHIDTQNVLEGEEVRYILDYLRALDDPGDDYRMVALLKSPFFRFTDSEVWEICSVRGGRGRVLAWMRQPGQCRTAPVSVFLGLLDQKRYWDIAGLTEEIVHQHGWMEYLNLRPDRREASANLVLFLDRLRSLQDQEMFHLSRFLYYLEQYGLEISPAQTAGEGTDALRIMTVHTAKGLQAKVVIYLASGESNRTGWLVEQDGRLGMKYQGPDALYRDLSAASAQKRREEEMRLFYVAVTRAEQAFYYLGRHSSSRLDGWGGYVEPFMHAASSLYTFHPMEPLESEGVNMSQGSEAARPESWYQDRLAELLSPEQLHTSSPQILTVTQILDAEFDPSGFYNKFILRSYPVSRSFSVLAEQEEGSVLNLNRTDTGELLHRVLQYSGPGDYQSVLESELQWAGKEWLSEKEKLAVMLANYYQSTHYQDLFQGREQVRKEWPFLYPVETVQGRKFLKGVIDCYLPQSGGEGILLDYKLHIGEKQMARYQRQLQYYALVLKQLGYPVEQAWLVELESGIWYPAETDISGLSEHLAGLAEKIGSWFRGSDQ